DLRRTLRRNISRGGDLLELVHAGKKRRKPGLVLLLDVSGSMNQYSLFFLRFAHALQQHFRRVHSFLFSTHLVEVSEVLRGGDLSAALELLSHMSLGWGGGTQIGESLQKLNRDYGDSALRGRPYLIVLSDGWDVGETELLSAELQALRRRVSKIIWLNPLLGMEGYEPLTRGMRTALPWLNVFAPAHNLESLLDIERHLVG
ncbi:MAG: VWA domain-containing protein, partial [SAR324 cluster bacterium]|nr:VWA domain-containing protein [SAR324 cluster bacterium]